MRAAAWLSTLENLTFAVEIIAPEGVKFCGGSAWPSTKTLMSSGKEFEESRTKHLWDHINAPATLRLDGD